MNGQPPRTRGLPRVCRGLMLAITAGTLAVTAHAMAGGTLPDPAS